MRRGPSPIKRRILSQFFNKFSNKKQVSQSVDLQQQKPPQIIKRKSLSISQIRNKKSNTSQFFHQQQKHKPVQKSIDDILSSNQPIKGQRHIRENNKKSHLNNNLQNSQQQNEQQQKQALQQNDTKDKQLSFQVSQQSINVNTSISFLQNQTKTILTLKTQNQLYIKEKQDLQLSLKQKQDQFEQILRQKSLSMSKAYKLEQDLLRKEKQLNRKVNEINVFKVEKQTLIGFINNFSLQIEEYMKQKEDVFDTKIKPQKQLVRSSKSQSKLLSTQKNGLQSISEDKQISLLQKINLKSLDQLTKSMQRGFNQNDVSKNTHKLINNFKKFIEQIKKSQYNLANNLKQQNLKLQKQYENQKTLINKIQRQLQNEKKLSKKLSQNKNSLIQQLNELKNIHEKCELQQTKNKNQMQSSLKKFQKHKNQTKQKQNKIQQLTQRIKKLQIQINQQKSLKQIQINKYEQQISTKNNQIQQLKQSHNKQLKTKQSQTLQTKRSLQQLQKRIKQFQLAQKSTKQTIKKLKQQLNQKQLQINQKDKQFQEKQKLFITNQKQLQILRLKVNQKQVKIKKIQAQILKKDKKIFQIEFLNSQMKKDLTQLRNQLRTIHLQLTQSTKKENQLKVKTEYFQKQNYTLNQDIKILKSKIQRSQKQYKQRISTLQQNNLKLQKQIYQWKFKIQMFQEQKKTLLQTLDKKKNLIQQMQIKIKILKSSTQTQNFSSLEKDQVIKRIKQNYQRKQIQNKQQKHKILQNERKLFDEKINGIHELYWRQKQLNSDLMRENELLKSQNQQKNKLTDFLNTGIVIIGKRLCGIIQQKNIDKLNTIQVNENKKISKQQIKKILSQDEPQFFYSMINMKLESKIFIQIFSNLYQLSKQLFEIKILRQTQQKNKLAILKVKDIILKKGKNLQSFLQKMTSNFQLAKFKEQIQIFPFVKQSQLLLSSSSIKQSLQLNDNDNEDFSELQNTINQFISKINETLTKSFNLFAQYKKSIQDKNQQQKQFLTNEMKQINQRNQNFSKLITNIQSKYLQVDKKNILEMQKIFIENFQKQLLQKQRIIQSLSNKISQLERQITFIEQRQIKLAEQNPFIKKLLDQQRQFKIKTQNQLKGLKQQLYLLKQYQTKRLQEKCQQLSIQLEKKNKQLKQAYSFIQRHLRQGQSSK